MSGVNVIRYLLANNAPVVAIVPATRIMAGDLPIGTVMPAIAVRQIDSVPLNFLRINDTPRLHTERVQVSVICKGPQTATPGTGYGGMKALMKLLLAACPSQRGTVNNVVVDSITPDIEGPDLSDDETALFTQSRDFLVRWSA